MFRSCSIVVAIACLGGFATGCDDETKVIDPFPITVDLSSGPVILQAQETDGEVVDIVVDVLSPITVLDSFVIGKPIQDPKRRLVELTLFGGSDPAVARVRFPQTPAYDLHSCAPSQELCRAGEEADLREIHGILGADILSRSSVRFLFPTREMRFFPDTAGSDSERTLACDAVFDSPFTGGGTLLIGGSEVRFGAWRPTVGACIHTEAIEEPDATESQIGTDLQMAMSTAIGPSLLTEEAYQRYAASGIAVAFENLPAASVYLPSGPVQGRRAEIPFLAITGDIGDDSKGRGPCRELYANARMREERSCDDAAVDCPCPDNNKSCKAAAAVELTNTTEVLVVPSGLPLLQALRDELRPQIPELDGVLGVQALESLQVEFDFPNKRMLMRCKELGTCATRPQVRSQSTLPTLDDCRAAEKQIRDSLEQDAGIVP